METLLVILILAEYTLRCPIAMIGILFTEIKLFTKKFFNL